MKINLSSFLLLMLGSASAIPEHAKGRGKIPKFKFDESTGKLDMQIHKGGRQISCNMKSVKGRSNGNPHTCMDGSIVVTTVDSECGPHLPWGQQKKCNAASIVDGDTGMTYYIHRNGDVEERNQADYPEEEDPPEEDGFVEDGGVSNRSLLRGSGNNVGINFNVDQTKIDESRELQQTVTIDVLVVYTQFAKSENPGGTAADMQARVDLAIAESNQAYANSNVDVELNLLYLHEDTTGYDLDFTNQGSMSPSLSALRSQTDGQLDYVHQMRTDVGADMVALITAGAGCGIAYLCGNSMTAMPSYDCVFSVTRFDCATGYYSFSHELGHNMGLNHDKGTSDSCGGTDSRFGFRQPDTNYRSILAYGCSTGQCDNMPSGSCTRQQFFSTGNPTDWMFNGQRQGWAANDPNDLQGVGETNNAQKIRNVAQTISLFNFPTGVTAAPTPAPTACSINAQCEDGNACTENVCINNQCSIGSIFQGNSCDDSNPCTAGDVCDAQGTCAGTTAPGCEVDLETTFANNNGSWGNVFNVQVSEALSILRMAVHLNSVADQQVKVYLKSGGYTTTAPHGFNANDLIYDSSVTGAGVGNPTDLPGFPAQELAIPGTYSIMVINPGGTTRYTNGVTEGAIYASNPGEMAITEGRGCGGDLSCTFTPRVWNGRLTYALSGPESSPEPSRAPTDQPTDSPVTSSPITASPTTSSPITASPTTSSPITASPTTSSPVTSLPTTSSPITASPTTSSPITASPTTSSPITASPTTSSPITASPTTSSPVTSLPTTSSPITASPTTSSPITASPTTSSPNTASPTTSSPITASPTTSSPITASPTTSSPITASPTTSSPNTASPTTSSPITASPTTSSPITASPTTSSPTDQPTDSPVTQAPTNPEITPEPSQSPVTSSPTDQPTDSPVTLSPTDSPTKAPTNTQSSYHYTNCGASHKIGAPGCGGVAEAAAEDEELHEVRCCADTNLGTGWNQPNSCKSAFPNTWGESQINGICYPNKNFIQASNLCSGVGARLCTKEELAADCTRGTGCSYDNEQIWSSTPVEFCTSDESCEDDGLACTTHTCGLDGICTTSFLADCAKMVVCGSSTNGACNVNPSLPSDPEELHEVRCCSDIFLGSPWKQHANCPFNVWAESPEIGNPAVCQAAKTYDQANQICSDVGARLCTEQELLNDCARGTGCSFDKEYNWSSTPYTG